MTHGHVPLIDRKKIDRSLAVLGTLREHPTGVRVIQTSGANGGQSFRLEIRDPLLGSDADADTRTERTKFYTKGLHPMIKNVLSNYTFPADMEIALQHDVARNAIIFSTDYEFHHGQIDPKEMIIYEPVHIMAKFFADNGINFPGASHFIELGK